ncbi:class D beta-lactamase [Clostridiaceae bacterium M8S5]|nr:class D beta-lactamase [Clostridiaceae bacterium M8S5]
MKKLFFIAILIIVVTIGCSKDNKGIKGNITKEDLSQYYDELDGCFILFDSNQNKYIVHNIDRMNKRVAPCSTFKIVNSLIGLETKVVEDENTVFKWDGKKRFLESWNKDHTLATAIANSAVWYYQRLAEKVGKEDMQRYLNKIDYGNKDISGGITKFWLQSSLKISPIEQIEILKRLYNYDLPFSKRNMDIVKKIIVLTNQNGVVFSGKTGGGTRDNKFINGWFIGYVEKDDNVYYFANNVKGEEGARGIRAKEITVKILKDKKILE